MNLIWICADTFRFDYLGCAGHPSVKTPRLDRLASEGVFFENAYCEGLPTGPERLSFMTGKFTLPFRGWVPLSSDETTIQEWLQGRGYRTALFCDCPHFLKPNFNYHRGFDAFHFIRGQEADKHVTGDKGVSAYDYLPDNVDDIPTERRKAAEIPLDGFRHPLLQYLRNVADRGEGEESYFPALTCGAAMNWLEENKDAERFMLWIELFDPHEPWDPPAKYYDLYKPASYDGPMLIAPWFYSRNADDYSDAQMEHIKALYAAEVTLVDHWIGRLLDKVDALGLRDDTAIVFTSDHGTNFGERAAVTKDPALANTLCRGLCGQPLIVRHPAAPAGRRVSDLVWAPDYMPTCLDMLGEPPVEGAHGRSFWPLAKGDAGAAGRDHTVSGFRRSSGMVLTYVNDGEWAYLEETPMNPETLVRPADDPMEANNVAADHPDVCRRMAQQARTHRELARTLNP